MFNRHYLHNLYGGSFVDTFPRPKPEKLHFHGLDDFLCLVLDYNPHAPVVPGNPGLFNKSMRASDIGLDSKPSSRVIVRVRSGPPALWQYMGQYRMYASESLTPEEYKSQSLGVRKTWAKEKEWGAEVSAQVFFRKVHHREPSEENISDILDSKEGLVAARSQLSLENIMAAYERGEEENGIYALKCVGYDIEFQRVLERNYKYFTPPEGKTKKGARPAGVKTKAKAAKRKRRSSTPDTPELFERDSSPGRVDAPMKEGVDSDVEILDYNPRTTRSSLQAKRLKSE
ncbi:hypothetical protein DAEQUDRAFT_807663 [Daedalea quercina L-15889]|uniref:DUF6697 domain-containing protein n=1 Tax=Daedalea quercina L-15889 TaxID=1314783 RepID=A0A165U8Q3_9APHY|nr:hypothetical protein DAEQUDRAFT_807663 [Daedalea quercina L-15889]